MSSQYTLTYDEGRFLILRPGDSGAHEAAEWDAASHRHLLETARTLKSAGKLRSSWLEPLLEATVDAGDAAFERSVRRVQARGEHGGIAEIEVVSVRNVAVTANVAGGHEHVVSKKWVGGEKPYWKDF